MFWKKQSETQKNWNDFFDNPKPETSFPVNKIILCLAIICILSATIYFSKNHDIEEAPFTNIDTMYVESNKNGEIMAASINTIEDILSNKIIGSSEDELLEYIETIRNLDLSIEYNSFKQQIIRKIEYYILFINSNNSTYLDKYNSISFIDEVSKAFDAANVKYEITDGKIYYWYTDNS